MLPAAETRLDVLNPGGADPDRPFPNGAGQPGDGGHPPVNYHAYAACTGGMFARSVHSLPPDASAVLLLVRPRRARHAADALRALRDRGVRVFVSLKESGLHQAAPALADPARWKGFVGVALAADGFLSSTPDLVPLYRAAGCTGGGFVPTPYPVCEEGWDFGRPLATREGVFVGTREFDIPSRVHLTALACAVTLGHPVTVINTSGGRGERMIRAVSPAIRIVPGPLPYPEYLHLMASHRIVFQCDRSAVPGQVAGDALLCRMPCVGGDSAIERLAFAGLHSHGRSLEECVAEAGKLLSDDGLWEACAAAAHDAAVRTLSFEAVRTSLLEFVS
jgi:hypothetical protein